MEVIVEFHSLWQLLPAIRIARALATYDTKWHEDPIKVDSLASLKPLCGGLGSTDLRL